MRVEAARSTKIMQMAYYVAHGLFFQSTVTQAPVEGRKAAESLNAFRNDIEIRSLTSFLN